MPAPRRSRRQLGELIFFGYDRAGRRAPPRPDLARLRVPGAPENMLGALGWPGKGPQSGAGARPWGAGPSARALGPVGGPLPRGWARGVRRVGPESVRLRDDAGLHMCLGSDFRASRRHAAAILATDLRILSSQA